MTSNLGSEYALENNNDMVIKELQNNFRPEFINRIDEIIVFNPLSKNVIFDILDKIIAEIEERLKDKNIKIKLTDSARDYLVEVGYDVNYGARPLKRMVSRSIETLIANRIISDEVKYGETITFDYDGNLFIK